ncbi:MAG: hypothetical protein V3T84_02080 [Phycisphaerales bacterium]
MDDTTTVGTDAGTMLPSEYIDTLRPIPEPRQAAAAYIFHHLDEKKRMKLFAQALWPLEDRRTITTAATSTLHAHD